MELLARWATFSADDQQIYRVAAGKASSQEIATARLKHLLGALPFLTVMAVSLPLLIKSIQVLAFFDLKDGTSYEWDNQSFWGRRRLSVIEKPCNSHWCNARWTYEGFRTGMHESACFTLGASLAGSATTLGLHDLQQLKTNLQGIWNPAAVAQEVYQKKINEVIPSLVRKIMLFILSVLLLGAGGVYAGKTQPWQALSRKII